MPQRPGAVTPGIPLPQEVLAPPAGQRPFAGVSPLRELGRKRQGLASFERPTVVSTGRQGMARQPALGRLSHLVACALETRTTIGRLLGERECGRGLGAVVLPPGGSLPQVRQGAVAAPCRQQDLARAQTGADRHGDPAFPGATLQRAIGRGQSRAPLAWHKGGWRMGGGS